MRHIAPDVAALADPDRRQGEKDDRGAGPEAQRVGDHDDGADGRRDGERAVERRVDRPRVVLGLDHAHGVAPRSEGRQAEVEEEHEKTEDVRALGRAVTAPQRERHEDQGVHDRAPGDDVDAPREHAPRDDVQPRALAREDRNPECGEAGEAERDVGESQSLAHDLHGLAS